MDLMTFFSKTGLDRIKGYVALFPLLGTPSTLRIRGFFIFWGHFGG